MFACLFSDWSGLPADTQEKVWNNRRAKLVNVEYASAQGPLTVQQGWWMSSHEQWKTWTLPYFDIPVAKRVFRNGEAARAIHSASNGIPGMFASVANTLKPSCPTYGGYVNSLGIQSLASQPIDCDQIVTPYAATPLLAMQELRPTGLVWYASMINGTLMQGPHGSTEVSYSGLFCLISARCSICSAAFIKNSRNYLYMYSYSLTCLLTYLPVLRRATCLRATLRTCSLGTARSTPSSQCSVRPSTSPAPH